MFGSSSWLVTSALGLFSVKFDRCSFRLRLMRHVHLNNNCIYHMFAGGLCPLVVSISSPKVAVLVLSECPSHCAILHLRLSTKSSWPVSRLTSYSAVHSSPTFVTSCNPAQGAKWVLIVAQGFPTGEGRSALRPPSLVLFTKPPHCTISQDKWNKEDRLLSQSMMRVLIKST